MRHPSLTVGIPIYAVVDHVHDYVVQAKGAFDETVLGNPKLKDKEQRVEVRVVLHAITVPRIVETCTWIARNLPFVDHVALMGLENTGFAIANRVFSCGLTPWSIASHWQMLLMSWLPRK